MIRCEELTKYFNGTQALNGCSFEILEPTLTGVIGVNGAGKTTLFKSLAGFLKPTRGEAYVLEEPAFQNIVAAQNVMLIEEGMAFYTTASLYELMESYRRFYQNFDQSLAIKMTEYFHLSDKKKYSDLSKGMKSTFRLILALSARAPLTLLDEPTTGMDPGVRKELYELILKDYIKVPRIILISSHYLGEMEELLDSILFIHEGKVLKHDNVEEFQTFLKGVQGPPELIESLEKNIKIYDRKDFGEGIRRIIVESKDLESLSLEEDEMNNLTVKRISPEDAFVYLTQRKGGGIDELYHS